MSHRPAEKTTATDKLQIQHSFQIQSSPCMMVTVFHGLRGRSCSRNLVWREASTHRLFCVIFSIDFPSLMSAATCSRCLLVSCRHIHAGLPQNLPLSIPFLLILADTTDMLTQFVNIKIDVRFEPRDGEQQKNSSPFSPRSKWIYLRNRRH